MQIVAFEENHDDELESYSVMLKMLQQHSETDALFIVAGGVYGAGRALLVIITQ